MGDTVTAVRLLETTPGALRCSAAFPHSGTGKVIVPWMRDAWQVPARPPIDERYLAPTALAPDRFADQDLHGRIARRARRPGPRRSRRRLLGPRHGSPCRGRTFQPVDVAVRCGVGALPQLAGTRGPGGGGFQCRMRDRTPDVVVCGQQEYTFCGFLVTSFCEVADRPGGGFNAVRPFPVGRQPS